MAVSGHETTEFDVDVIILSLDRTTETLSAIDSALSQKAVRVRVIVIDQGSTADCVNRVRERVRADSQIELRELGRNLGCAGGRNMGFALARAPYVCILDNDAVFADETTLCAAKSAFGSRPDLGAVALRIMLARSGEDQNPEWLHPTVRWDADRSEYDPVDVPRFIGAGAVFRRKALSEVGGFDENIFIFEEERDLSNRLINGGWRIMCFPDLKVVHSTSQEHRTHWTTSRYFYLVRNQIYCSYKRGDRWLSVGARAGAFVIKGTINGMPAQGIRGGIAGLRMIHSYRRETPLEERQAHRLKPAVRKRIALLEGRNTETVSGRILRFLRPPSDA